MRHLEITVRVYMWRFTLEMDEFPVQFVPVPYFEFTSLHFFLQKHYGLKNLQPAHLKAQSTQTEPPTKEIGTQTNKQPGLLWGYFH